MARVYTGEVVKIETRPWSQTGNRNCLTKRVRLGINGLVDIVRQFGIELGPLYLMRVENQEY